MEFKTQNYDFQFVMGKTAVKMGRTFNQYIFVLKSNTGLRF